MTAQLFRNDGTDRTSGPAFLTKKERTRIAALNATTSRNLAVHAAREFAWYGADATSAAEARECFAQALRIIRSWRITRREFERRDPWHVAISRRGIAQASRLYSASADAGDGEAVDCSGPSHSSMAKTQPQPPAASDAGMKEVAEVMRQ